MIPRLYGIVREGGWDSNIIKIIKYNKLNQIAAKWFILWTHLGGWGIFENDNVVSDCMGDSVESDCKDKYYVNVFKW